MPEDINFNLIIVIVFLVIGAIRWFIENALGKKKPPVQPQQWEEFDYEQEEQTSQSSSLEDLYEEARREILERQNTPAPEPPVVLPQRNNPAPPPLPGKARINRPAPPKTEPKKVQRREVTVQQAQAAAAFEQHSNSEKRAASVAASGSRVRKLLASPSAARDAIILAEILGKPKGVR
ncbi:MAG: hypothetical protein ACSHYB_00115 [Roseibacillus sp.]